MLTLIAKMADWDALFAKAADIQSTSASISTRDTKSQNENQEDRKNPRKRKRKKVDIESSQPSAYSRMLASRMDPPPTFKTAWNSWMAVGSPLCTTKICNQWASSGNSNTICDNCGKSPLNHRLILSNEESWSQAQAWHLFAFLYVRNIRCCARCMVKSEGDKMSLLDTIQSESSKLNSLCATFYRQLKNEESSLLESKLMELMKIVSRLWRKRRDIEQFTSSFEDFVRLVIACDNFYYRLYYLQLTTMIPTLTGESGDMFLPHPQFYFGLPYLTMKPLRKSSIMNSKLVKAATEVATPNSDLYFLLNHLKQVGETNDDDHPLSAIHRYRFVETISLFSESGWASLSSTRKLVSKSLEQMFDEETKHETPAPEILMEWRDSCRDFMCNLFAYATLSKELLETFVVAFRRHTDCKSMIEIGAGTGYIAKLFKDAGICMTAFDICPTSSSEGKSMNEYHGHTPSFYSVDRASNFPPVDVNETALLLCYPPPGSKMAYETLCTFLRKGGKAVVHIGEFKGLTGESKFESTLLESMMCKIRLPCLGWGTDASSITIWVKKDKNNTDELLLPCSTCNVSEGTRRSRLLRNLVYCSKKCYKKHKVARQCYLQMHMTEIDKGVLHFESSKHFFPL